MKSNCAYCGKPIEGSKGHRRRACDECKVGREKARQKLRNARRPKMREKPIPVPVGESVAKDTRSRAVVEPAQKDKAVDIRGALPTTANRIRRVNLLDYLERSK